MATRFSKIILALTGMGLVAGCTGQLPSSFRFAQQKETFNAQLTINTKIDLLWVVDNSASMDVAQDRLRKGFTSFAHKYMQPTWDIRVGVITTDVYLANPGFSNYLNSTIGGTVGWTSPYILTRLGTWINPPSNPSLVNLITGKFDNGVKIKDLVPVWGPNYAKLLPGIHDGPIPGLCFEGLPYFLNGATHCNVRDNQLIYSGTSHCLNPNVGLGESEITQCVNTSVNNTVRSGKAIIDTMPPVGTPGDATWVNHLIDNFIVNVTTGSAGSGSERGLGSVLQLLTDNETSSSAFFRANSIRGIIFISDEEDQTQTIPAIPPGGFGPFSAYKCDQASLVALNGAGPITGMNGFCCSTPGNNCSYGSNGTSCPSKTVDTLTYTVGVCPDPTLLVPVATVKNQIDSFFHTLDGSPSSDTNYFVTSIVPLTKNSIQTLQAARDVDDTHVGAIKMNTVDRGDRYIQLGQLVGNGSMELDLGDTDYTPILNAIGNAIIEKVSTFTLTRAPSGEEEMIVFVVHADGSTSIVDPNKYVVTGNKLAITDLNYVLSLKSTDKISIDYQPKSET